MAQQIQIMGNEMVDRVMRGSMALLVGWALVGIGPAQAQTGSLPKPAFAVSAPKVDKVVEVRQFFYRTMAYEPMVRVRPVAKADAGYDTPEAAAISSISAMLAGDLTWFRSTWDDAARALMENNDRDAGRSADYWPNLWRERLSDKQMHLTHRIETGTYVLIAYRASPVDATNTDPAQSFDLITVLHEVDGRWVATQELMEDPVLHYWDKPGYQVEKMGRNIGEDPK